MPLDLNADLGEEITDDAGLLAVVTSANVACGYHAGSVAIMREVCAEAARLGVSVGAQVSYDDREHFGRVARDVPADVLRDQVADQVRTLGAIAEAEGTSVRYLKPHGALYHRVGDDEAQAAAVLAGSGDLPVLGLPGALILRLATDAGRRVWHEGFPDRGYTDDGRLLPRDQPGAVLQEEGAVVAAALALAGRVDSLCVHGDHAGAVARARAVRRALEAAGHRLTGL
ncbi:5-oxoprolinase subunit PxpA [Nocardioides sp. LHG3406-4]|uniref:5-oxoprolinase subunit PxpA n=1 Tax=Nocardioides sp. LHG3406-4 TaxID=2804575 RepID=UPI003CF2DFD2